MKNIRSNSIAALSLMLLLSTPTVHSMETVKGLWSSTKGLFGSVVEKTPSLAEVQQMVSNKATALYETAKEHPYITAAALVTTPVIAAAGIYGLKKVRKSKRVKAEQKALINTIEEAIYAHFDAINQVTQDNGLNGTAKVAGRAGSLEFGKILIPVLKQLTSKEDVQRAGARFIRAVIAWDDSATYSAALLREVNDAVEALQKLGLNILPKNEAVLPKQEKPSLKERVSALVPTKAQFSALVSKRPSTKQALFGAAVAATPVAFYAYNNGYFGDAMNAVSNVDYAGRLAQVQTAVAPVTGFVANHPYAFGAIPVAYGTSYVARRFVKNRTAKAEAAKQAEAAKALKPAPELNPDLKDIKKQA